LSWLRRENAELRRENADFRRELDMLLQSAAIWIKNLADR
jgi:hypothetical protein